MTGNSLYEESVRFDNIIREQIHEQEIERDKCAALIEQLLAKLQDKEMAQDRSENMDFQITSDSLAQQQVRLNQYEALLASLRSELNERHEESKIVQQGSTVEVSITDTQQSAIKYKGRKFIIRMVQHDTSFSTLGLVACDSKLGAAIMNRVVGEEVVVQASLGAITYRVERIY